MHPIIWGVSVFVIYSKAVHLEPWLHVYSANTLPMRTRWNIIEDLQATPTIWLSTIDCFVINTTKACVKDFMDVKGDLLEKNHTVACLHFEALHDIDAHKGKYIPLVREPQIGLRLAMQVQSVCLGSRLA